MKELITNDWYNNLVDDCKAIITEGVFTSRWALIETYHKLGQRILEDKDNFTKSGYTVDGMSQRIASSLGKSQRTVQQAIQFVRKFPDMGALPKGKNISWNKVCNELLPVLKTEKIELPEGKYSVIYADPAWQYRNTGVEGAAEDEYPTMSIQELCAMNIKESSTENAVLFLWVTNPLLEECFEVIKSWGFQYKTNFVWHKQNKKTGIGFYIRGVHELLLICVKGQMLPEYTPLSIIEEDAKEHSRKPEMYEVIEKMYPNQKYLELFARNKEQRKGWTYWGNQANES